MEEIVQKLDELVKAINSNSVLDWIAALVPPKSLASQGFFLSHKHQNHSPYAKTYANLQSKTHGKFNKNQAHVEPTTRAYFWCL